MKQGLPFCILVVDDDEDDRIMIDEAFKAIGIAADVKKFINAKALFHYLDNIGPPLYPSLIVLDNSLPEIEAADILSDLKGNDNYQSIPVVIYTSSLSPVKKQQLLSLGAYRCFEKGNTMKEIIAVAEELKHISQNNLQQ